MPSLPLLLQAATTTDALEEEEDQKNRKRTYASFYPAVIVGVSRKSLPRFISLADEILSNDDNHHSIYTAATRTTTTTTTKSKSKSSLLMNCSSSLLGLLQPPLKEETKEETKDSVEMAGTLLSSLSQSGTPTTTTTSTSTATSSSSIHHTVHHSSLAYDPHKYSIILDLDETLLHSYFPDHVSLRHHMKLQRLVQRDRLRYITGKISFEEIEYHSVDVGDGTIVTTQIRPGLWSFLRELAQVYNLGVWSAGGSLYVNACTRLVFDYLNIPLCITYSFDKCRVKQQLRDSLFPSYDSGAGIPTKPLNVIQETTIPSFDVSKAILFDNRKENAVDFPLQYVEVPDFFEPESKLNCPNVETYRSADTFLLDSALLAITDKVLEMEHLKQLNQALTNTIQQQEPAFEQFLSVAHQMQDIAEDNNYTTNNLGASNFILAEQPTEEEEEEDLLQCAELDCVVDYDLITPTSSIGPTDQTMTSTNPNVTPQLPDQLPENFTQVWCMS
jgi:hypothetical protein